MKAGKKQRQKEWEAGRKKRNVYVYVYCFYITYTTSTYLIIILWDKTKTGESVFHYPSFYLSISHFISLPPSFTASFSIYPSIRRSIYLRIFLGNCESIISLHLSINRLISLYIQAPYSCRTHSYHKKKKRNRRLVYSTKTKTHQGHLHKHCWYCEMSLKAVSKRG